MIEEFERCTLPKEKWTHENHFVAALWYCVNFPLPEAVRKIREGIKVYNIATGGVNTDTAGYHETITLFFVNMVTEYIITNDIDEVTEEAINILLQQPFVMKGYIDKFYSKGSLMAKEARLGWRAPDRGGN